MSAPLEAKTETATNKDLRSEALREIESRTEAELDVKGASRYDLSQLALQVHKRLRLWLTTLNRITAIEKAPESLLALTHEERVQLEKRVVRKIDFTLLPILMVMCMLHTRARSPYYLTDWSTTYCLHRHSQLLGEPVASDDNQNISSNLFIISCL